jgi:hypothetical protein
LEAIASIHLHLLQRPEARGHEELARAVLRIAGNAFHAPRSSPGRAATISGDDGGEQQSDVKIGCSRRMDAAQSLRAMAGGGHVSPHVQGDAAEGGEAGDGRRGLQQVQLAQAQVAQRWQVLKARRERRVLWMRQQPLSFSCLDSLKI